MIEGSEGPVPAGRARDSSDDTIELQLTREQQLALSEAAWARAHPDEVGCVSPALEDENLAFRRTAHIDTVGNVTFAVAVLAIVVVSLWPAASDPLPPPVTGPVPVALAAPAVQTVVPQGMPVRITNAFDATEVFEFPPGTPESEAREAVAELLLSRARDRRAEKLTFGRAGTLQADRGVATQPPDVVVTRLLARAKDP
jgi:hypothetical protein